MFDDETESSQGMAVPSSSDFGGALLSGDSSQQGRAESQQAMAVPSSSASSQQNRVSSTFLQQADRALRNGSATAASQSTVSGTTFTL